MGPPYGPRPPSREHAMSLRVLRPRAPEVRGPAPAAGLPIRWDEIQAGAHLPEVQEFIRQAIARGAIRVMPDPDGGVRIAPTTPPRR